MRTLTLLAALLAGATLGCDDEPASTPPDALPADAGAEAGADADVDAAPGDAGEDPEAGPDAAPGDADVPPDMAPDPSCGDGVVDEGEECDDGNLAAGDGCDGTCVWEPGVVTEPDRRGAPLDLHFGADGLAEALFDLERDDDEDWFRFELTEPADVALAILGVDGDECPGDPELAVFRGEDPAFLLVDDTGEFICPRPGPSSHPELGDLEPGTYYVRVRSARQETTDGYRLQVWLRDRVALDGVCDLTGFVGRCPDGARCARFDYDTNLGVCLEPGCGDWLPDDGEACDGPEGHCTAECALLAEPEVEPNDTTEQATPMGPAVEGFGDLATAVTLAALDDVDHLRISVPPGPPMDLRIGLYDGFFGCPDGIRTSLLDSEGAFISRTDEPCGVRTYALLPTGTDYVLRIVPDAVSATNVPLFVFAEIRTRPDVGEVCSAIQDCRPGAWCVEDLCVADACGDGRQGPDEACDDGNVEAGDGCDAQCVLEDTRVDPPGGEYPFDLLPGAQRRFLFSLDAHAALRAVTGGVQICPGDTRLRVLNAQGDELASNDDADEGTICSNLLIALPPGEDYELWVDSPGDDPLFEGRLTVTFEPVGAPGAMCGQQGMPPCQAGTWCNTDRQCAPLICGDGEIAPNEECDDGNREAGDGCSPDCVVEGFDVNGGADVERPGLESDEADYFTFEIDTSMRLQAWTDNNRGRCADDTFMELDRWEAGEWVGIDEDDDGGLYVCSRIDRPVPPGRYELVVSGADGGLFEYWMHVRLLPQIPDGEPCARSGEVDACLQDRWCRPTDEPGVGVCGLLAPFVDEVEPDLLPDLAQRVAPDVAVRAHLDPQFISDDYVDLFVVTLDAPARLRVQTGDGEDGCPGDTIMYELDADDVPLGIDAAIENAVFVADDMEHLRCSEIERDFPAGEHWFAVESFNRDETIDYVFRARTLSVGAADARCDAHGVFDRCADGLACLDPDGDGDGTCRPAD